MQINFALGKYEVRDESLLPFVLQGCTRDLPSLHDGMSSDELIRLRVAENHNSMAITMWLASRVLPLTRDNAKKIYTLLHLDQRQDDYSKAEIALLCRAVSLQDNYWVKLADDPCVWHEVNLRTNRLNAVVAQVALHGSSLTFTGSVCTPELTGQGAYAKAWKRLDDTLWLYKRGAKDPTESRIEVMVSCILDKCSVAHVSYELTESTGGAEGSVLCCRGFKTACWAGKGCIRFLGGRQCVEQGD